MVYRSNIDPGLEEREADAEELAAVMAEAELRRLRAIVGVVAFLALLLVSLLVLPTRGRVRSDLHCHYVEIRFDNAPEIPGNRWQSCEWR